MTHSSKIAADADKAPLDATTRVRRLRKAKSGSMSREATIRSLARLERRLRACGVAHLALFGSRARNDHREDSDLDVVIDVTPNACLSLLDLVGIGHVIEDSTGIAANVFTRRSLQPDFERVFSREGVAIF